jgi:hypothetical protein
MDPTNGSSLGWSAMIAAAESSLIQIFPIVDGLSLGGTTDWGQTSSRWTTVRLVREIDDEHFNVLERLQSWRPSSAALRSGGEQRWDGGTQRC